MEDLFRLPMRVGTSAHLEQATVQAKALPVAEARAYGRGPPTVYGDETGWP
jgi:hypothetical protein